MKPKRKKLRRRAQYISTNAVSWAMEQIRKSIESANKDGYKEILLTRAVAYTLVETCRSYISLNDRTLKQLKKENDSNDF